jgi:hypothetical protein
MFNPSRDQVRQFFIDSWRKQSEGAPLMPIEAMAAAIAALHPEYHALLESRDEYIDRDYPPEHGKTNPFLHLSMHLAIAEQLSIDQPPGIRASVDKLAAQEGSRHHAEHAIMDCLAETLWQAQQSSVAPDASLYLECINRKLQAKK